MIPLIVIISAAIALAIGFTLGREWNKVDASESFEEGRLQGYMEGYDVANQQRDLR